MADENRINVNRRVRATGEDAHRLIAMMRAAFPDAKFSFVKRVQDDAGDLAFVWSARGEHSGEVEGFPATWATATIVAVASAEPREGYSKP
ncbi:MAG: hypothetical protein ACRDZO_20655 [Egibacteraceae bacterium]